MGPENFVISSLYIFKDMRKIIFTKLMKKGHYLNNLLLIGSNVRQLWVTKKLANFGGINNLPM